MDITKGWELRGQKREGWGRLVDYLVARKAVRSQHLKDGFGKAQSEECVRVSQVESEGEERVRKRRTEEEKEGRDES